MHKIALMRQMMRKIAVLHKTMRKTTHTIIFMHKMMHKMMRKTAFMHKMMRRMKILSPERESSRSEQQKTFKCHIMAKSIYCQLN